MILAENQFFLLLIFILHPSEFILFRLSSHPMQPTLFSSIHLTVSQLTFHIRKQLENDPTLQDVWVEGEISNLSRPIRDMSISRSKIKMLHCVV